MLVSTASAGRFISTFFGIAGNTRNSSAGSTRYVPVTVRLAEILPALTARHIVDLAMPAAMAASDRLSMTFSPRLVARHGKAAIRAFKLGFRGSGGFSEIGAYLCAISLAGASDEFSIAFPPSRGDVLSTWLRISYRADRANILSGKRQ